MAEAPTKIVTADLGAPAEVVGQMRRQQFFLLVTMATRLVGGLVTFVVQARFLGPHGFGVLGAALSVATIASLVSDFGVHSFVMRRAGVRPGAARRLVLSALTVKLVLTIPAALLGLGWTFTTGFTSIEKLAATLVIAGFFLHAIADIMFLEVRATARMEIEARTTIWTFALISTSVALVAALTADVLATAAALFVSRLIYFLGTIGATIGFRSFREVARRLARLRRARPMMAKVRFFAADALLTNAVSQVDVVVLTALLPTSAVGIYVAGSRLVQNGLPVFAMLANLYLPLLAGAMNRDRREVATIARRFNGEFAALALVSLGAVIGLGPLAVHLVYGPHYAQLNALWPAFAAFVAGRVLVGSIGVQLIAANAIAGRVAVLAAALLGTLVLLWVLVPAGGIGAAAWVLAGGAWATLAGYLLLLCRNSGRSPGAVLTALACLCATAAAVLGWRVWLG